jgi:hypothetical protein
MGSGAGDTGGTLSLRSRGNPIRLRLRAAKFLGPEGFDAPAEFSGAAERASDHLDSVVVGQLPARGDAPAHREEQDCAEDECGQASVHGSGVPMAKPVQERGGDRAVPDPCPAGIDEHEGHLRSGA